MTPTPRTDAVVKKRDTSGKNSSEYRWVEEVPANFSRGLEREITMLHERLHERTQGMLAKQVEMLNEIRRLNRILEIKERSKQNPYAGL